jgi:hypothetical protein
MAATEAGRAWGYYLTQRPPPYRRTDDEESVSELLRILGDIGFVPDWSSPGSVARSGYDTARSWR